MSAAGDLGRGLRWLLFGLGLLLAYPLGLGLLAALRTSLSWPTWALLGGLALCEAAALSLPLRRDRASVAGALAGASLLVVSQLPGACERGSRDLVATARADAGPAPAVALAAPSPPAWLLEERDLVLLAAQMLPGTRWLEPGEAAGLREGLAAGYAALIASGDALAPGAATWRGRQTPGLVDALVVPGDDPGSKIGLIFLHGFGGSFAWPCWAMARAARGHVAITLCPSLGSQGYWWSERGLEVAQRAVDGLRARGITRYLLAGLSNGAHGAGTLASALQPGPAGLILVSGLPRAAVPRELPVLLLQGDTDRRVSTARARRLAAQHPGTWTYIELAGDHFVWLRQTPRVERHIDAWLHERVP